MWLLLVAAVVVAYLFMGVGAYRLGYHRGKHDEYVSKRKKE